VGNDVFLGQNGILLYGINASGKSSFMKAIGLNVIMAQAGMFVAARNFVYMPYYHIFTRISGMDNIYKGMSSFTVEMTELRNILQRCNKNSLVIGDEICCGTESVSALAIVASGIDTLIKKKSSFIFATHLHELVNHFEQNVKIRICHLHVEYTNNRLIYDRSLRNGDGPKTYGVEVCRYLNMTDDFVKRAIQFRQILEKGRLESVALKSKYNRYLMHDGICESCGKQSKAEVHHIKHQASHNQMEAIHMNMLSNLMVLCEECHDKVHAGNINVNLKHQTSNGIQAQIAESTKCIDTNTTDISELDKEIIKLSISDHLSISKVIEAIYKNKGISLTKYRVRKTVQHYKKLMKL